MTNRARSLALVAAVGATLTLALASTMVASAQSAPMRPAPMQPVPPPPFTTPNTDACPFATTPPPVIDLSEVPQPEQTVPPPVPRPANPIGGTLLGQCGLITVANGPAVPEGISSASWVIADLDSGHVLAAKDPHGRYRPASTLKLFTAAVALNALPLDEVITGTQEDADVDGSRVGVGPGGRYTVRDLLLGLLLQSGNDAAHALAARMGGHAATVAAMNTLAASLGATDTRAVTPSGLDGPGMSASAYDLALIFRYDIANPVFAQLAATPSTLFPGYGDKPPFVIANQDQLLTDYPGALGGKNGFTNDARQTYVGAAQRDGRRLMVTLMAGERLPLSPEQQAAALLDYGFALPPATSIGELVAPGSARPSPATAASAAAEPDGPAAATTAPTTLEHHPWMNGRRLILLGFGLLASLCLLAAVRRVRRRHG